MESPQIVPARAPEDIEVVRALFVEYQSSLEIDLCFQGFAEELAGLPGAYAAPSGRLFLGTLGGEARGVVALRAIDELACEMKRLYVQPSARGTGTGKMLVERVIAEARAIGYQRMLLDTLPSMSDAIRLYERYGFRDIPAYRYNPVAGARYMGLVLR